MTHNVLRIDFPSTFSKQVYIGGSAKHTITYMHITIYAFISKHHVRLL